MLDDNLLWLSDWDGSHCDGDWEHIFGIKIYTLDNPGWSIKISVQETELQDKAFKEVDTERPEMICIRGLSKREEREDSGGCFCSVCPYFS
jgi:hypothetical protein